MLFCTGWRRLWYKFVVAKRNPGLGIEEFCLNGLILHYHEDDRTDFARDIAERDARRHTVEGGR